MVSNLAEVGVKGYFLQSDNFTETSGVVVQQIYEGGAYFSPIVVKIIEASPQLKQDLPLSNAEMNVLRVLLRWPELSRKAQAELLIIIPSTLQKHIKSIITKLNSTQCGIVPGEDDADGNGSGSGSSIQRRDD